MTRVQKYQLAIIILAIIGIPGAIISGDTGEVVWRAVGAILALTIYQNNEIRRE